MAALGGVAALGSTEEAWQEFRERTEAACRALLPEGDASMIEVNPFGTDSAGIALVRTPVAGTVELSVCVMDKQSGAAELSAPFPPASLPEEPLPEEAPRP